MAIPILRQLFARDLGRLINELRLYNSEEVIWQKAALINNPAGNLALHIIGNLNTYIGAALGNSGYTRNREAEFSATGVSRNLLIAQLEETARTVDKALANLPEHRLNEEFPVLVFEKPTSTAFLLIHLATHLSYHLGQVNYHRRLLDNREVS